MIVYIFFFHFISDDRETPFSLLELFVIEINPFAEFAGSISLLSDSQNFLCFFYRIWFIFMGERFLFGLIIL